MHYSVDLKIGQLILPRPINLPGPRERELWEGQN